MEVIILILSFLILVAIGVPIAWSIGMSSLLTMLMSISALPALTTVAQRMATGLESFSLMAIPFFIIAGHIMNRGGIAKRLVAFAKAIVGSLPGGLTHVNIIGSMLFGAISGSAVAAISALGTMLGPEMEKAGYEKSHSAAANISAGTMGLLIPPSNVIIVYSLASGGVSIAALFLAGYIPGLIICLLLMLTAIVITRKKKFPKGDKTSLKLIVKTGIEALPSLLLLIVVVGGIVAGIFTATEASAVAVLYCLILLLIYKEVVVSDLPSIIIDSVSTTAIVLLLVSTSMSMSWVLSYENVPQDLSTFLFSISDNKYVILFIINLALLLVGIFIDITPAVLIFTPIFLPVVQNLGVHPTHFGIMMILNLCIGICTPPVGSALFVGVSVAEITIRQLIRPMLPFYVALLVALLLVTYIPDVSLLLPRLFGYD